jgi:hypothetical protein
MWAMRRKKKGESRKKRETIREARRTTYGIVEKYSYSGKLQYSQNCS